MPSDVEETVAAGVSNGSAVVSEGGASLAVPHVSGWGWSLASRWAILYALPQVLGLLRLEFLHIQVYSLWHSLYPSFLRYGLRVSTPVHDTALSERYGMLYEIFLPLVVALVWMAIDRKRKHEAAVMEAARLLCRYALAAMLFYYG